jgi:uncharacterized protein
MIDFEETSDGILLRVKSRAGGAKNAITSQHDGMLKVSVTQAPEKGKANKAIVKLLANSWGLQKSQITLIAGPSSPQKKFLLSGIPLSELRNFTYRLL